MQKTNSLIVGFFSDSPPCSAKDCPEMRASEWQYLCAVHDPPKSCCAIDYCCHTLDWAANVLTSQKHFPSRLTLGGDAPGAGQASVRQLTNIFRRVYRMFAHAWFQHRDVFWALENQEGIYIFYKTVCDVYQLIPEENYTVPPEAEGLALDEDSALKEQDSKLELNAGAKRISATEKGLLTAQAGDQVAQTTLSTGATTRRHKSTPSTGSLVTTIAEGDEENEDKDTQQPLDDAALPSTVRRDPSSSPPKRPSQATNFTDLVTAEETAVIRDDRAVEVPKVNIGTVEQGPETTVEDSTEAKAEESEKMEEKVGTLDEEPQAVKLEDA